MIIFSSIFWDKLTVLFWTYNNPCVLVFSWVSLTRHVPQKYLYYIIWLIVHDLSNLASKRFSLSLMYLKYMAYVLKALWTNCISLRHTWCPFMVQEYIICNHTSSERCKLRIGLMTYRFHIWPCNKVCCVFIFIKTLVSISRSHLILQYICAHCFFYCRAKRKVSSGKLM